MTLLKIFLGILLAITAAICIIFLSNAAIEIKYKNAFSIILRILFVRIDLLKSFSGKNKKKPKKQRLNISSKKSPSAQTAKKLSPTPHAKQSKTSGQKKPLSAALTFYKDLAISILTPFAQHLHLKVCRANIVVASKEPSDTAIEYGAVMAVANSLYAMSKEFKRFEFDDKNINISCDFLSQEPRADIMISFRIRIFRLVVCAFRALMTYLRKDD